MIYQIYPMTFNESGGRSTGKGNILGIKERIDYLGDLGVDAVWISPFYPSPWLDGGYDVSDMKDVHSDFGDLDQFKDLVTELHSRDIKVMIDFIPSHTSDQHQWFQDSIHRRDGRDDYYIWSDGVIDETTGETHPPNNWASVFSIPQLERRKSGTIKGLKESDNTPPVSAWTWNEERGQYYLHSFAEFQPDINWANPEVRAKIKDVMRFWLDLGVDGFRVDAVNYIGKNIIYDSETQTTIIGPSEEANTAYEEGVDNPYDQLNRSNSCGYTDTFYKYVSEIMSVLKEPEYQDREKRAIFEAYMPENDLHQIDEIDPSVSSSFNFTPIDQPWSMPTKARKMVLDMYHRRILRTGNIPNTVMGNHDKPRAVSKYGHDQARALALYCMFQSGMMFIYNGEELGRKDHESIPIEMIRDPNGLRDPVRTPMPWDGNMPNMGFSSVAKSDLYLPINPSDIPVSDQEKDPASFLSFYRAMIKFRKKFNGEPYRKVSVAAENLEENEGVLAYGLGDRVSVFTNFTDKERRITQVPSERAIGLVALSSMGSFPNGEVSPEGEMLKFDRVLRPNESVVVIH